MLPDDVLVFPVTQLAPHVRETLDCPDDHLAVTRPGFRTLSRLVDSETASLLEEFREPTRLVDGVLRFSRRRGVDPEQLLEQAFPVLQAFTGAHILVPEASPLAEGVKSSFAVGQTVASYTVRRHVQALEDSEIYQVSGPSGELAALKIARSAPSYETVTAIQREAAVLDRLAGACSPSFVEAGTFRGRPFLTMEWLSGVPISTRARELRTTRSPGWRARLHALGVRLLVAYTTLHAHDVAHGDVHTGNIFVDAADLVYLLDFGLARFQHRRPELNHARRAGLAWFMAPEVARALLQAEIPPPVTLVDEQYSIAAMLYVLLCGEHYLDAPPEREALYRHVIETPVLPFARRGFETWPAVEAVLARALAKNPEDRFPSTQAFLDAFRSAQPAVGGPAPVRSTLPMREVVGQILDVTSHSPAPLRELFPEAPLASAQYGAAGLAWFLYRAAQVRDSADLLAAADLWARRAAACLTNDEAFHAPSVGITTKRVSPLSLYHRAGGVYTVQSLVGLAKGELVEASEPLEHFTELLHQPSDDVELAFGRSGLLVGGALLFERLRYGTQLDAGPLTCALVEAAEDVWAHMTAAPEIGASGSLPHLGMAHGWAGILYAQMRVAQSLGRPLPVGFDGRLEQLASLAEPYGRGVAWPGTIRHADDSSETPAYAPGWCSGTAGYVLLWTHAYALTGASTHLRLAEQAAWHTWEHPDRHPRLCCGLAGRGFALITCYRYTGDVAWLRRARELAEYAALAIGDRLRDDPRTLSLYWGVLGPSLLAIELEAPERTVFPLSESEGWMHNHYRNG